MLLFLLVLQRDETLNQTQPNCPVCRMSLIPKENTAIAMQQYNISHQIDTLISFLSARMRNDETIDDETIRELFEIY